MDILTKRIERLEDLAAFADSLDPKRYNQDIHWHSHNLCGCLLGHYFKLNGRPMVPGIRYGLTEPQVRYIFGTSDQIQIAARELGLMHVRSFTPQDAANRIRVIIDIKRKVEQKIKSGFYGT